MAELSAETQAIIERLKAEGQLVRNSGTNSIRSVKIQLDRFEGVFNTISANVVEQTKILQMQAGLAQEAVEAQRSKEQFDELKQEKEEKIKTSDNGSETNKKIDDIGDKISSALSLKNLALAGAGLFVGYNLLKGFIDDRTGGGFTRFEENFTSTIRDMDWERLKNDIFDIGNTISQLSEALTTLLGIVQGFIDNPWSLFGLGLGFGAGRFLAGRALSSLFGIGAGGAAGGAAGAAGGGGFWAAVGRVLLKSAGPLALGAAIVAPDDLGDGTVSGQAQRNLAERGIMPPHEAIANVNQDMYDRLSRAYQEQLDAEITRIGEEMAAATQAWVDDMNASRTPEEEARLAELRAQNMERDRLAREQRLRDAARQYAAENPGLFDPSDYVEQFERQRRNTETSRILDEQEAERVQREIDELTPRVNELDERLRGLESADGQPAAGVDPAEYNRILDEFIALNGRLGILTNRMEGLSTRWTGGSYRTGTQGFMDFGDGQFALLHGREAVVPFNTAAGRFLDAYFTDNWEPRVANQGRIETVASGAAGGGAPVIINAPTTVSPNITNVEGSKSVNSMNVTTGRGGGGGGYHAYGLPLGVN